MLLDIHFVTVVLSFESVRSDNLVGRQVATVLLDGPLFSRMRNSKGS